MEHGKQRVIERMPKSGFSPQVEGTKEEWRLGIPRNIFVFSPSYEISSISIFNSRTWRNFVYAKWQNLQNEEISNFAR